MLAPPFLELAYFVGRKRVDHATALLWPGIARPPLGRFPVRDAAELIDPPEEVETIGGTVVLRTEGEFFCGTAREDETRLKALGYRMSRRFLETADLLDPVYGAILIEYSLEEPADLKGTATSLAFQNFFLGTGWLDEDSVRAAVEIAGSEAYVEERKTGVYVAMSSEFGANGRGLSPLQAQQRSARIGSRLANSMSY